MSSHTTPHLPDKLSSPNALMTQERLDHYWEHGYVVVPGLIDEDHIARWRARFDEIITDPAVRNERMLVMKDVMVAKGVVKPESANERIAKVQDFERDPVLKEYIDFDPVLDCVEALIGQELISIHTMLINKPPNVDGRHPLHQDLLYFPFRPAHYITASWTALDRCTKENGCLQVVPGTHRGELVEHENPDWEYLNLAYYGAKGFGEETARHHLEMKPGDTVFFHPILVHGSGRNRTSGVRRSISAHYASRHCDVDWADERFGGRVYQPVRRRR